MTQKQAKCAHEYRKVFEDGYPPPFISGWECRLCDLFTPVQELNPTVMCPGIDTGERVLYPKGRSGQLRTESGQLWRKQIIRNGGKLEIIL